MPASTPNDEADDAADEGGDQGGNDGGNDGIEDDWSVDLVADEADWQAVVDVRMRVFVDEQGVPEELELDEHDEAPLSSAVDHLLVRDAANDAVAVARLRTVDADAGCGDDNDGDEVDRVAKVERVAVARDRRGEGLGARVMRAAEARARERGFDVAVLHAQTQAAGFYERLGYETDEAVGTFVEDGIEHVRMRRSL